MTRTHRSVVAGGCWVGRDAWHALRSVNTGVRRGPHQALLVLGGGVKVLGVGLCGAVGLGLLPRGVAAPAAHGEEEVVVDVVLGFVFGRPDLLLLL